jgi:hypothetical protein
MACRKTGVLPDALWGATDAVNDHFNKSGIGPLRRNAIVRAGRTASVGVAVLSIVGVVIKGIVARISITRNSSFSQEMFRQKC